jgi:hypothetical protein
MRLLILFVLPSLALASCKKARPENFSHSLTPIKQCEPKDWSLDEEPYAGAWPTIQGIDNCFRGEFGTIEPDRPTGVIVDYSIDDSGRIFGAVISIDTVNDPVFSACVLTVLNSSCVGVPKNKRQYYYSFFFHGSGDGYIDE